MIWDRSVEMEVDVANSKGLFAVVEIARLNSSPIMLPLWGTPPSVREPKSLEPAFLLPPRLVCVNGVVIGVKLSLYFRG